MRFASLLACCVLALSLASLASASPSLVVQTVSGQLEGVRGAGVDKFLGIPYAAPPVGPLRWALPQAPASWSGVRSAKAPGNICPQIHIDLLNRWLGDEDCLYLNVVAPTARNLSQPLPVWVWIYGGGWVFGDGIEFGLYDASNFANAQNVIVVSMNYRLGSLGFLSLPAMRKENAGTGATGNWGLQDQLAALQWVQNNIAAFGGDPSAVTIGGESAGAFSTCVHRTSPLSDGLFRAAIMESGTCVSEQFFSYTPEAWAWGNTFTKYLGCDPSDPEVLQCLRALDMQTAMGPPLNGSWSGYVPLLFPDMPWSATIDGYLLPDDPYNLIVAGKVSSVPTLAGSNLDEGSLFVDMMADLIPGVSYPLKDGDLNLILDHFFDKNATLHQLVAEAYPLAVWANATAQAQAMLRDFFFLCPTSRALLGLEAAGAPTWNYQFTYHPRWIDVALMGVYHSLEIEFVFNNEWPPIVHAFSDSDKQMAAQFGAYWSNLIRFGDPNGDASQPPPRTQPASLLHWPAYNASTLQHLQLDVPSRVGQSLREAQCEMWDSVAQWVPVPTEARASMLRQRRDKQARKQRAARRHARNEQRLLLAEQ